MGLQLLRESIVSKPEVIQEKNLPNNLRERTSQELTLETQLNQLWEDSSFKSRFPDQALFEKVKANILKETTSSTKKTYKMPIGRYDVINNNNRIYPKKLWENVIKDQKDSWQGLCGLADHPEGDDPGQWKYSTIVWLDMQLGDDGVVYGIGRFVGPYGSMAEDIIDAGGRVGFSSSGFGEVDQYSKMVNPDTYMMERVADVVLNPSQNVFGETTNEENNIEYAKKVTESTQPTSAIVQNNNINKGIDTMKVDATNIPQAAQTPEAAPLQETSKLSKVEEKAFRRYVESFMSDADNIENPSKRLQEMAEILSMFEDGVAPDLREKFEEKLIETRQDLETLIESTVSIKNDLGVDVETLTENAKKIAEQGTLLKENIEDYKLLLEGATSRNRTLDKEVKSLRMRNALLESKKETLSINQNKLKVGTDVQIAALIQENSELLASNKSLEERVSVLNRSNNILEKGQGRANTRIKETTEEISKIQNQNKQLHESNLELSNIVKTLEESISTYEKMLEHLQQRNQEVLREKIAAEEKIGQLEHRLEEELLPQNFTQKPYHERVKGMINFRENDGVEIEKYWQDQLKAYGESIMPYERQIRGAKTLKEATSAFFRHMKEFDTSIQQAESARDIRGIISSSTRHELLSESGYEAPNLEVSEVNNDFLARAKKMGLK